MASGANLKSIDAIRDFRAALIEFTEEAKLALMEAHSDVLKTTMWIQHDRLGYWQHTVRKRHEKVQQCKSELYRAQMQSRDERPSCVVERKALVKAQAEADEAQRKIEACRKALASLDREGLLFKAALAGFSTSLEVDMPNVVAHLDRLMDTLAKYVAMVAPSDDPRPLNVRAAESAEADAASSTAAAEAEAAVGDAPSGAGGTAP